jgi:hypothetical protein
LFFINLHPQCHAEAGSNNLENLRESSRKNTSRNQTTTKQSKGKKANET